VVNTPAFRAFYGSIADCKARSDGYWSHVGEDDEDDEGDEDVETQETEVDRRDS
jgi:hypothetical protein